MFWSILSFWLLISKTDPPRTVTGVYCPGIQHWPKKINLFELWNLLARPQKSQNKIDHFFHWCHTFIEANPSDWHLIFFTRSAMIVEHKKIFITYIQALFSCWGSPIQCNGVYQGLSKTLCLSTPWEKVQHCTLCFMLNSKKKIYIYMFLVEEGVGGGSRGK